MPKTDRWDNFPEGMRQHLIDPMRERAISITDLNQLRLLIDTRPEVPEGGWFKDFGSFKICGHGSLAKTFLYVRTIETCSRIFIGLISLAWDMLKPMQKLAESKIVDLTFTGGLGAAACFAVSFLAQQAQQRVLGISIDRPFDVTTSAARMLLDIPIAIGYLLVGALLMLIPALVIIYPVRRLGWRLPFWSEYIVVAISCIYFVLILYPEMLGPKNLLTDSHGPASWQHCLIATREGYRLPKAVFFSVAIVTAVWLFAVIQRLARHGDEPWRRSIVFVFWLFWLALAFDVPRLHGALLGATDLPKAAMTLKGTSEVIHGWSLGEKEHTAVLLVPNDAPSTLQHVEYFAWENVAAEKVSPGGGDILRDLVATGRLADLATACPELKPQRTDAEETAVSARETNINWIACLAIFICLGSAAIVPAQSKDTDTGKTSHPNPKKTPASTKESTKQSGTPVPPAVRQTRSYFGEAGAALEFILDRLAKPVRGETMPVRPEGSGKLYLLDGGNPTPVPIPQGTLSARMSKDGNRTACLTGDSIIVVNKFGNEERRYTLKMPQARLLGWDEEKARFLLLQEESVFEFDGKSVSGLSAQARDLTTLDLLSRTNGKGVTAVIIDGGGQWIVAEDSGGAAGRTALYKSSVPVQEAGWTGSRVYFLAFGTSQ